MDATLFFILVLIGLFTGIFSGLVGTGGGLIMVPCFILFLGLSQHESQGLSLAVLLPPITIFAVKQYHKKNKISLKTVLILSLFFVVGSFWGSVIALQIDARSLQMLFGGIVFLIALRMIFR